MEKIKQFIKNDCRKTRDDLSKVNRFVKEKTGLQIYQFLLIGLVGGALGNPVFQVASDKYKNFKNWYQKPSQIYISDVNNDGIEDIVKESKWGTDVYFGVEDSKGNIEYLTLKQLERGAKSKIRDGYGGK